MTTTRRRLTPQARRDQLLDVAAGLALDAGDPTVVTLERVAEAAGCSRNLAYRYFPNHRSLLEALAEREGRAVRQRFAEVHADAPFEPWFEEVVAAYLDLAQERGRLLLMLFEQSMFPGSRRRRSAMIDVLVGKLVAEGVRSDQATVAASILASALMGGAGSVVARSSDRVVVAAQLRRVAATLIG